MLHFIYRRKQLEPWTPKVQLMSLLLILFTMHKKNKKSNLWKHILYYQKVHIVEQDLLTLPKHLWSIPAFVETRCSDSSVLCLYVHMVVCLLFALPGFVSLIYEFDYSFSIFCLSYIRYLLHFIKWLYCNTILKLKVLLH